MAIIPLSNYLKNLPQAKTSPKMFDLGLAERKPAKILDLGLFLEKTRITTPAVAKEGFEITKFIKEAFIEFPTRYSMGFSLKAADFSEYIPGEGVIINPGDKPVYTSRFSPKVDKMIFGTEPIKPLGTGTQKFLEERGIVGPEAETLGILGGGFALGLAVIPPFGSGARTTLNQVLKKSKTAIEAMEILVKRGVPEEIARNYGEKFARLTDIAEIEKGIKSLEGVLKTTKVAPKVAPKIAPEAQKAIKEAIPAEKGIIPKEWEHLRKWSIDDLEYTKEKIVSALVWEKNPAERKFLFQQLDAVEQALREKPTPQIEAPQAKIKPEVPVEKGIIPPELQPLAQEARKFKSAEEFADFNAFKFDPFKPDVILPGGTLKKRLTTQRSYNLSDLFSEGAPKQYKEIGSVPVSFVGDGISVKGSLPFGTKGGVLGMTTMEKGRPVIYLSDRIAGNETLFRKVVGEEIEHALIATRNPKFFAQGEPITTQALRKVDPNERAAIANLTKRVRALDPKKAATDFYTQAVKGVKAEKGIIPPLEEVKPIITGKQLKPTKTIVREMTGQNKAEELRRLNEKLKVQSQSARTATTAEKKRLFEEIRNTQEQKRFLESIREGILTGMEKEKNQIRKQIGFERHTKELSGNVLSRIKEKNGIKEWSNATKEQLQAVLDDLKNLQKGDEMISRGQVESLKKFGVNNWTTKREAADILGDVVGWKGRTARFFDFFKTMDQKITKTAGKDAEKVKDILTRPREEAVTKMFKEEIRLKTEMREMLNNLRVNNTKDRALIMRFGEKRISLEELKKARPDKWQKIIEADKWFRKNYDELLETTNAEMKRLGYSDDKLIPKRQDYYTHSQELGTLWNLARRQGGDISPVLEQISEFTRPNRKFNPFALRREGGEFVEDAGKAFEVYLNPILNNKYLTESIVRHRAVADILAHKTLQTKNVNQFIFSLRDAADSLAGKTNPFDRALMNRVLGRKPIQIISWMSQRFGKNRIIGNIGSALMQISGIPNSVIKNNIIRTSKGLIMQAFSPFLGKNDPLLKSSFLLRRYGEKGLQHGESVFPSIIKKGEKIAMIPFEVIERNITKGLWRASFDNAWSQGFRGKELMDKADEITASVVGSRSIGEKAMAFESGVLSLPLQFQLEVNTSAQLWKDEVFFKLFKDPLRAIRAAIEASITLYLMNTLFDKTMGRTPLPDPIRAIQDAADADNWLEGVGRIAGEGLANVAGGQFIAGLIPRETRKKYFGRSEVGIYPGGIPVTTALSGGFKNPSKFVYDFVLPFGGGQLKKILEGIEGLDKMGSYSKTGKLQFPINQNQWLQVILFGKYSTKEAKEYFDKQRTVLSDKQTVEYFLRTQKGENPQEVYADVIKDRIRKEYEKEIIKEIIKKIKANPIEGLALLQLWKKQNIITDEMEKDIIDGLSK